LEQGWGYRRKFETKLRVVLFLFGAVLVLVTLRVLDLQVAKESDIAERIKRSFDRVATIRIPLYRGSIRDASGRELAMSIPTLSVYVHPDAARLRNREAFVRGLSRITGVPVKRIESRLKAAPDRPVRILRGIDRSLKEPLRNLILRTGNSQFVGIQEEYTRYYPNRTTAANLLGFVGVDGKGLEGLEYMLDKHLGGGFSSALIYMDGGLGRIYMHPLKGMLGEERDVVLTLDLGVQNIIERIRDEIVRRWKPKKISMLVMDLISGDILGLATYPYYDPNRFSSYPPEKRRNYAVTDAFEPGSIMKPFFIGWAYEKGYVSPAFVVNTGKGRIKVYDRYVRDPRRLGRIRLKDVIVHSSNVGTIKVAAFLKKKDVEELLKRFHMNRRFGILPGEAKPQIPNLNYPANILYASIGQGIAMNTLNIAVAFGGIATGRIVKPRIVREIRSADGKVLYEEKVRVWREGVMSEKTLRWLRKALVEVVERGTGIKARSRYFTIAGKTGTSQKFDLKTGFFPASDPRFVAVIVVDEPKGKRAFGGNVNAPYFKKLVEQISFYYGLKPDKPKK